MKIPVQYALVVLILAGCNSKKNQTADTDIHEHGAHDGGDDRTKELMAIHDSIMPAMSTMMNLKAEISGEIKKTDSLLSIKFKKNVETRKQKALKISGQLEKADREMMNWMHQYRADTLAKLDHEQASRYIADQKVKIESVRTAMQKSIEDARGFIGSKP